MKKIYHLSILIFTGLWISSCSDDNFSGGTIPTLSQNFEALYSTPYNTQENVGDPSIITIEFSEPIDANSVQNAVFLRQSNGNQQSQDLTSLVASGIQVAGRVMTIPTANGDNQTLGNLANNAAYTVEISPILQSTTGKRLRGLTTVNFCSGVCNNLFGFDTDPDQVPYVIGVDDDDLCGNGQNLKTFTIYFSEPVYAPIVNIGSRTLIFGSGSGTFAITPFLGARYDAWSISIVRGTGFLQGNRLRILKRNIRDFDGQTGEQLIADLNGDGEINDDDADTNGDGSVNQNDPGCPISDQGCAYETDRIGNPIVCAF